MGFPRSHRYIIIWWLSGWLAFSFGRFTVDLELAKFSSISRGNISVFSPKVRCGSKNSAYESKQCFRNWYFCDYKSSPAFSHPWSFSSPNNGLAIYSHFIREGVSRHLWIKGSQQGQLCLPGGTWQYLGAAPSPSGWGGSDGHATGIRWGPPRMLNVPSYGAHSWPIGSTAEAEKRYSS